MPAKFSKLNGIVSKISEKARGKRISRVSSLLNNRNSNKDSFNEYMRNTRKTKGKGVNFKEIRHEELYISKAKCWETGTRNLTTENFQMVGVVLEKSEG